VAGVSEWLRDGVRGSAEEAARNSGRAGNGCAPDLGTPRWSVTALPVQRTSSSDFEGAPTNPPAADRSR